MPANLENSAVATGLEKVSFHFSDKEPNYSAQYQERKDPRMLRSGKTELPGGD